jgi:amino acid efflux transporter
VVLGVLNAYVGAFAKLGASLGRDGDLPATFGRGAGPGEVPRPALALVGALSLVNLAALSLAHFDLEPFILVQTSCMVAVYVVAMAAALRLLTPLSGAWWLSLLSTLLSVGLLVLAGTHLMLAAVLALAAVAVSLVKRGVGHRPQASCPEFVAHPD